MQNCGFGEIREMIELGERPNWAAMKGIMECAVKEVPLLTLPMFHELDKEIMGIRLAVVSQP